MDKVLRWSQMLQVSSILVRQIRCKGHSKWQNIQHTKAANDARKGAVASRFTFSVRMEAIKNGADPKINRNLQKLIEDALRAGVRKESLNRQLLKATNAKIKTVMIDIMGPGRCLILLESETENVSRTRTDIKSLLRKTKGTALLRDGEARHAFDEKGVIKINRMGKSGKEISFERAEEIGIEAGAEEVINVDEDEEVPAADDSSSSNDEPKYWKLMTDSRDLFSVKGYIEKNLPDVEIIDYETEFVPKTYAVLEDQELEAAANLCQALENMEDVNKLYVNIQ